MEKTLFNLKYSSKQLHRESAKCEKQEKLETAKLKAAMAKNKPDLMQVYAENAIRNKNQAVLYAKLASKLDGVCSRVQTAVSMTSVTKDMLNVVKSMEKISSSMSTEQISKIMDRFDQEFESLDVRSTVMDKAMTDASSTTTPADQVMALMKKSAAESGIDLDQQLPSVGQESAVPSISAAEEESLNQRLAKLRQ